VEDDPIRSLTLDIGVKGAVHYILAEMCGNRFFEAVVRSMLRLTSQVVQAVQPDPRIMHPAGMHRPVVEAVLSGDQEAARLEMRKHTEDFGRTLMEMEQAFRDRQTQA
jgi:DNA-binding FadR family transcriptional regulator